MTTLYHQIRAAGGKFIKSTQDESIHPSTVFWAWLRVRIIAAVVLLSVFACGVLVGLILQ